MMTRTTLAALALLGGAVLTGCGDGDGDKGADADPTKAAGTPTSATPTPTPTPTPTGTGILETCLAIGDEMPEKVQPYGARWDAWVDVMDTAMAEADDEARAALQPWVDEMHAISELEVDLDGITERLDRFGKGADLFVQACEA
ncbi:hypothetical protein [Pimelobacter sp. 30-1]|uniref:hypothetical protein n=1 Tax=Pimelobacter sp. 30-1 TaxID=2004991 RepID=UPI001C05E753|nr:hypothetical protein [Pimelobacter sp. 30-1]MBU2697786.1 hypothetical protein [Pimelobacter sp. 30-1]